MSITSTTPGLLCRPRAYLHAYGRRYPHAWHGADVLHSGRGDDLPDWPDWCYLPASATQAMVARDAGLAFHQVGLCSHDQLHDAACLTALATWRVTQGIYRFDYDVYEAVRGTPVIGDIPHQILYHLPEWCVYVETPGLTIGGIPLYGFFAHLDYDIRTRTSGLSLVLDANHSESAMLTPISLPLGAWSLAESIRRMYGAGAAKLVDVSYVSEELHQALAPLVSLLLYLCSQAGEIGDGTRHPGNPRPKKTRRGWRLFPADNPRTWGVGVRLGAALRRAYQAEQPVLLGPAAVGDGRARPRAHVRRAHWHTVLSGPRTGERTADLRWFPPIPVLVPNLDALAAVVRPVA